MKSIQGHLRQLLQTVSPSNMLAILLRLDAFFGHVKQIYRVQDASQTMTLHRPNSITKRLMACSNMMEIAPN